MEQHDRDVWAGIGLGLFFAVTDSVGWAQLWLGSVLVTYLAGFAVEARLRWWTIAAELSRERQRG